MYGGGGCEALLALAPAVEDEACDGDPEGYDDRDDGAGDG